MTEKLNLAIPVQQDRPLLVSPRRHSLDSALSDSMANHQSKSHEKLVKFFGEEDYGKRVLVRSNMPPRLDKPRQFFGEEIPAMTEEFKSTLSKAESTDYLLHGSPSTVYFGSPASPRLLHSKRRFSASTLDDIIKTPDADKIIVIHSKKKLEKFFGADGLAIAAGDGSHGKIEYMLGVQPIKLQERQSEDTITEMEE